MSEQGYHMMAAILSQPGALLTTVEKNTDGALQLGAEIAGRGKGTVYVVGTGTSFHCAELSSRFFSSRNAGKGVKAVAYSSFDFANYTPPISREDTVVVISHRGYKNFSNRSLRIGRERGCHVAAVTGYGSTIGDGDADTVFRTVEQEVSSAHTVSFTTALAVMLSVAMASSADGGEARTAISSVSREVADAMSSVLAARESVRRAVAAYDHAPGIWIAGGGPNGVVAKEGSLKIQETCYINAFGFEVEQMIHGPMRAASIPQDLFIPIIWGASAGRCRELASSLSDAGGHLLTISESADDPYNLLPPVKHVQEHLSPFVTVIPLQLTALYLAMLRGTNPDSFRSTDPYFARLDRTLKL